jgi:transposase-like protein
MRNWHKSYAYCPNCGYRYLLWKAGINKTIRWYCPSCHKFPNTLAVKLFEANKRKK